MEILGTSLFLNFTTSYKWADRYHPKRSVATFFSHGGLSSVMKLAKVFGESGVSAVHFEDQLHGGKKCGHQYVHLRNGREILSELTDGYLQSRKSLCPYLRTLFPTARRTNAVGYHGIRNSPHRSNGRRECETHF